MSQWANFILKLTPNEISMVTKRANEVGLHPQVYARRIFLRAVKEEISEDPSSRLWPDI